MSADEGDSGELGDDTGTDSGDPNEVLDFNRCGVSDGVRASGTWVDPVILGAFGFADVADTSVSATDLADAYDCSPSTPEHGPEVVYAFSMSAEGYFRAEVVEAPGVDVDLHLLAGDATISAGVVSGCLQRHNTVVEEAFLPAGTYLLVVDTYASGGVDQVGEFDLYLEAGANGAWHEQRIARGLTWRHRRDRGGKWDDQTIDVIAIESDRFELAAISHDGCQQVEDRAASAGAIGAINGGFFGGGCTSLDMVKRDGVMASDNTHDDPQRTLVWDDGAAPQFAWISNGVDPEQANALGGWPSLVTSGDVLVQPDDSSFHGQRHPRSAMALTDDGTLLMVTVDGRSSHGDGATLPEFAEILVDLGAFEAVNLDGGGSTTAFLKGCSATGVVNHPSDNGGSDHGGARSVSDGLYVIP